MNVIDNHKAKWAKKTTAVGQSIVLPLAKAELLSREYEVLKQLVHADYQRLKNTPDDGTKHKQQKTTLLNNYREYLTGWIAAGEKHNNDVLFFNIVWAADVGDWDWLLKLTDYAIATGQTNTVFKSNAESIAAREIQFAADALLKVGIVLQPWFFAAFEKIKADEWVVHNSIKAKFYKVAGIDAQGRGDLEIARDYYTIADELYPNVAVKGRLKEVIESL